MRTLKTSLFTNALLIIFSLLTLTASATNKIPEFTSFRTNQLTFNKISISGNVKIVLTQSFEEEVRIDEYYNPAKTTILKKGYMLLINSTENKPITIKIRVKDLQRIQASGNVSVSTKGKFDLICLQLFLSDNASANVKADVNTMYTIIKDEATVKLSGTAKEHTYIAKNDLNIDFQDFICQKNDRLTAEPIASK